MTARPSLALIGFGAFSRFAAPHLAPHFHVVVHDAREIAGEAEEIGLRAAALPEAGACDVVVLAVPAQSLEPVLLGLAGRLRPDTLVVDVCSVKVAPVELMLRCLPAGTRIVGTHPLFGPQSGKEGIAGLPIALCRARADTKTFECVSDFLGRTLGLRVFETTPEAHDRQMAYVQGLTHFISRAVASLDLPTSPMATRAYARLLDMKRDLENDSTELFLTIERMNPFAAEARREFRAVLEDLERLIRER